MDKKESDKIKKELLKQIDMLPPEQKTQGEQLKAYIKNASPEQIEDFVKKQIAMQRQAGVGRSEEGIGKAAGEEEGCVFCGIAEGKIDTIKLYESGNVLAILDINPASNGHTLIIPKQHQQFLFQLSDEVYLEILNLMKRLMPIIINTVKAEGLSIYIPQGIDQVMPHLTINLIPRFRNDTLTYAWERKKADPNNLKEIAVEIITRVQRQEDEKKSSKKRKEREKSDIEEIYKKLKRRP